MKPFCSNQDQSNVTINRGFRRKCEVNRKTIATHRKFIRFLDPEKADREPN